MDYSSVSTKKLLGFRRYLNYEIEKRVAIVLVNYEWAYNKVMKQKIKEDEVPNNGEFEIQGGNRMYDNFLYIHHKIIHLAKTLEDVKQELINRGV